MNSSKNKCSQSNNTIVSNGKKKLFCILVPVLVRLSLKTLNCYNQSLCNDVLSKIKDDQCPFLYICVYVYVQCPK